MIEQDLQDTHLVKPVLDGNTIKDLFGLKRGGSFLETPINHLVAWQFDNTGCGVQDTKKWLYEQRDIRNPLLKYRSRRAYVALEDSLNTLFTFL